MLIHAAAAGIISTLTSELICMIVNHAKTLVFLSNTHTQAYTHKTLRFLKEKSKQGKQINLKWWTWGSVCECEGHEYVYESAGGSLSLFVSRAPLSVPSLPQLYYSPRLRSCSLSWRFDGICKRLCWSYFCPLNINSPEAGSSTAPQWRDLLETGGGSHHQIVSIIIIQRGRILQQPRG